MHSPTPLKQTTPSLRQRLARLRGSSIELDLRPMVAPLAAIRGLGEELKTLTEAELRCRARSLHAEGRIAPDLEGLLPRAYALAGEAVRRVLGLDLYDVQIVGAVALHRGKIVEMETGEGKTLVAVLPAYLNALSGRGVHVLTFNDYLAERDAEWMGPVYRFLGLSVGWVREGRSREERRSAYASDVTYVTAKEAGFDLLRDLLATQVESLVHRPFHCAIVDEADSLLIDEARVPLVLAGSSVEGAAASAQRMAALAARFERGIHFEIEEYDRNVELTDAGFDRAERELGCGNLLAEENYPLLTELNCALHARMLLRRDVDYLVRGGKIELVDELTGRVAEGRHWPDGLQAALEAKEGLDLKADGRILGSITLEHFLGSYPRLCGMTGTARDAARDFHDFYGKNVVVIPTYRPRIRVDREDLIFTHREAKEKAIADEIRRVNATGRPILVGTLSVEESERLAAMLGEEGIRFEVLNAKSDAREAPIIAAAGALGAVTISTNMAGRGTDIRLGGHDETERDRVVELGGLYVIGTNRHESRRIDLQLRGRAGRQGDPGESRFFLSLEDPLLERYGARRLISARFLPPEQDAPIEIPAVRREVDRVQRIIEGQNFEIRKTLWRYATPIEDQRRTLHRERQTLLLERRPTLFQEREEKRRQELVRAVGEDAVRRAETLVTLFHIDRAWSEHLALIASLREGIHLVGLGGEDPLTRFRLRTAEAFHGMRTEIEEAVLQTLRELTPHDGALDLKRVGVKGPSSTWTYLVSDDPFRRQLGRMLTGPGGATLAIGGAILAGPFFFLWLLVERFLKKSSGFKPDSTQPP